MLFVVRFAFAIRIDRESNGVWFVFFYEVTIVKLYFEKTFFSHGIGSTMGTSIHNVGTDFSLA